MCVLQCTYALMYNVTCYYANDQNWNWVTRNSKIPHYKSHGNTSNSAQSETYVRWHKVLCKHQVYAFCAKNIITIYDSTDYIILLRVTTMWDKIRILWWLLLVWESVPFPPYLTHSWCIAHYTCTNLNMFCHYTYHISLQAVSVLTDVTITNTSTVFSLYHLTSTLCQLHQQPCQYKHT